MNNCHTGNLTKGLLIFLFVLVPSFVLWFFFSKDWNSNPILRYSYTWMVAIAFVIFVCLLSLLFIYLEWAWYDIFNFALPCAIVMMCIMLSYPLPAWARILITIPLLIVVTLLVNIASTHIGECKTKKKNEELKFTSGLK